MSTALNVLENKSLRRLERTIESGLQSFVTVGKALVEIRDSRLYRESHKSFEAYCAERWNIKRQRAYELIEASGVAERVSQISDTQPKESHAAELAALPEEQQAEAWQEVVETTDEPTAAVVKEVVAKRLPDKAVRIPVPDYDDEPAEAETTGIPLLDAQKSILAIFEPLNKAEREELVDFVNFSFGGNQ